MRDEPEVLEPAALDRLLRVGGQDFVIEMIDLFLLHAPQRLEAATEAMEAGDLVTVHRSAHSLKSTAANMGGLRLQAAAARAEAKAAAGAVKGMNPLIEAMRACFTELRPRLVEERARREALLGPPAGEA